MRLYLLESSGPQCASIPARAAYWFACKTGAARIDLAGQAVGIVTEGEAAYAAERLAEYHARAAAIRKAAQRAKLVERATAVPVAAPEPPTRASLADLHAAAARRRAA
jgi:sRNA-binding protein